MSDKMRMTYISKCKRIAQTAGKSELHYSEVGINTCINIFISSAGSSSLQHGMAKVHGSMWIGLYITRCRKKRIKVSMAAN